MSNIDTICKEVRFGNLNSDDLNELIMAVKYRRLVLGQEVKRSVTTGMTVKFKNSRTGKIVTGTVEKINRKNVMVREQNFGLWRVPSTMIEVA